MCFCPISAEAERITGGGFRLLTVLRDDLYNLNGRVRAQSLECPAAGEGRMDAMLNASREGIRVSQNCPRRAVQGILPGCAYLFVLVAGVLPLISPARADETGDGLFVTVQNPIDSA